MFSGSSKSNSIGVFDLLRSSGFPNQSPPPKRCYFLLIFLNLVKTGARPLFLSKSIFIAFLISLPNVGEI
jgi:hypothetical protein